MNRIGASDDYRRTHHKLHWAHFPELRFDVSNGVTLCKPCHRFIHWAGRYIPNKTEKEIMRLDQGHYYTKDGLPMHFIPKKKGGGNRPTTVSDARSLGLIPSPTQVLKVLAKPALTEWLIRTSIEAFATAPNIQGETLDDKIKRVLDVERQQDQESTIAKDRGTDIHNAIEMALNGSEWDQSLSVYVIPVLEALKPIGRVVATEKILVGDRCAGRTDAILESDMAFHVIDFKTSKKLPKEPYPEHRMQISFYASAMGNTGDKRVECTNIYISTTEPGQISVCNLGDWAPDYRKFRLLLDFWYLHNEMVQC